MDAQPVATIADLEAFVHVLEMARLEIAERIAGGDRGYVDEDVARLALHGAAVQSVRDAIAFRRRLDGK